MSSRSAPVPSLSLFAFLCPLHPPCIWFACIRHDSTYISSLLPHSPCYATTMHPSIIPYFSPLSHLTRTLFSSTIHLRDVCTSSHTLQRSSSYELLCLQTLSWAMPCSQPRILRARLMYLLCKSERQYITPLSLSCAFAASAVPSASGLPPATRTTSTLFWSQRAIKRG